MFEWNDYSIHDLVALTGKDDYVKYMATTLTALKTLEKVYILKKERDEEAMEEYTIVLSYLKKIANTFELLRKKYLFNPTDALKIDKSDSGFVNFYEISQIETDLSTYSKSLLFDEKCIALKEKIVISLLQKGKVHDDLLAQMAVSQYQKGLVRNNLFLFFNEGQLSLKDEVADKRKYFYHWACYDKKSNMPYIYLLDFEQDLEADSLHESDQAFEEFMKVIHSEGSRAPAAGIVAMAIDQRLEHIHPKLLKRLCIGPLYSKSFSVDLDKRRQDLFLAGDEGRRFALQLTEHFVFSIGQSILKDQQSVGEVLRGKRVRERFYIPRPTDSDGFATFSELEEQKASLIRKTVVIPYKLHQHIIDVYSDFKIISFTRSGSINGV